MRVSFCICTQEPNPAVAWVIWFSSYSPDACNNTWPCTGSSFINRARNRQGKSITSPKANVAFDYRWDSRISLFERSASNRDAAIQMKSNGVPSQKACVTCVFVWWLLAVENRETIVRQAVAGQDGFVDRCFLLNSNWALIATNISASAVNNENTT